ICSRHAVFRPGGLTGECRGFFTARDTAWVWTSTNLRGSRRLKQHSERGTWSQWNRDFIISASAACALKMSSSSRKKETATLPIARSFSRSSLSFKVSQLSHKAYGSWRRQDRYTAGRPGEVGQANPPQSSRCADPYRCRGSANRGDSRRTAQ